MTIRFSNLTNVKFPAVIGSSSAINDDAWSLLWDSGDAMPTLPAAAGTLGIVSTDAGDDTDDFVVVDYLDSNWAEKRAIFVPNGTSDVAVGIAPGGSSPAAISAFRVMRARYYGDAANAGRIDIKIGSEVLAAIPVGKREAQTPLYTVPVGQVVQIHGIGYACSEAVQFRLRKHVHGETGWITEREWYAAGPGRIDFPRPIIPQEQGEDGLTWTKSKITYALEAYAPDAGTDTDTEAAAWLDVEVYRTDGLAPGFPLTA